MTMEMTLILTLALTTATFQVVHPALVILAIVLHPTAVLQARTAETVLKILERNVTMEI